MKNQVELYKPFLSAVAFNPRHPMFQKFMFEEPPAPPTAEEVKALKDQLTALETEKASLAADAKAAADYKRDMLANKDKVAALEKELGERKLKEKETLDKTLESQGQFKSLYENVKKELDDVTTRFNTFKTNLITRDKGDKVLASALKEGLKTDMVDILKMLPMTGVTETYEVNPATQETVMKIYGVEEFVQALKKEKPTLFGTPGKPGVSSSAPPTTQVGGKTVINMTPADLQKLKVSDPKKYSEIYGQLLKGATFATEASV